MSTEEKRVNLWISKKNYEILNKTSKTTINGRKIRKSAVINFLLSRLSKDLENEDYDFKKEFIAQVLEDVTK